MRRHRGDTRRQTKPEGGTPDNSTPYPRLALGPRLIRIHGSVVTSAFRFVLVDQIFSVIQSV